MRRLISKLLAVALAAALAFAAADACGAPAPPVVLDGAPFLTELGPHIATLVDPEAGLTYLGRFVAVDQILCVESEGNYTRVTTDEEKRLIARQTMKHWVDRLPSEMFAQLDRSLIVNRKSVLSADFSARPAVVALGSGTCKLQLGRAAASRLREILAR